MQKKKILRMAEGIKQKKGNQARQVRKALEGLHEDREDIWESLGMGEEEFNALPEQERERLEGKFTGSFLN